MSRSNGPLGTSVYHVARARVVVLETRGEVIGGTEDFFKATGHGLHLRYLARAVMAWTITGPPVEPITPIS